MRIRLPDFSLEFEERGSGTPLLFIHGYPLNRTLWTPQLEALSGALRLIAPDLRGHGQSDSMPAPYTMEMLADDCCALLDAMGVTQPVIVCGLSMGGYVTFAFYRKYAARVAGLILAATRPGPDSPQGKTARAQAIELARERGAAAIASAMLPKMFSPQAYTARPELVEQLRRIMESTSVEGIVGDLMGMMERPDSTPTLAQIDAPTLVLHGADDQLIPLQEADAMNAGIRRSRLRVLPGAGHLLNLEQPEMFNDAVRKFIHSL